MSCIARRYKDGPRAPVSSAVHLRLLEFACGFSAGGESHMENAPGCQMATESFGTGVGYEHIYQVQCFYVEHVEIPWFLGVTARD